MAHVPERKEDMSSYTEGQVHMLMEKFEKVGFTSKNITSLGQLDKLDLLHVLSFINNESVITTPDSLWKEKNGVIYFDVGESENTGELWIKRLESKGFIVDFQAKDFLLSDDFETTKSKITKVAVIKKSSFGKKEELAREIIENKAKDFGFKNPTPDIACLTREKFTEKDKLMMGLPIILIMSNENGDSMPLGSSCDRSLSSWNSNFHQLNSDMTLGTGTEDSGFAYIL